MSTTNQSLGHPTDDMDADEMADYLEENGEVTRLFTKTGNDSSLYVAEYDDQTGLSTLSIRRVWKPDEGDEYEQAVYLREGDVRELSTFLTFLVEEWPRTISTKEQLTDAVEVEYDPVHYKEHTRRLYVESTAFEVPGQGPIQNVTLNTRKEINALEAFLRRGSW